MNVLITLRIKWYLVSRFSPSSRKPIRFLEEIDLVNCIYWLKVIVSLLAI